MLSATVVGRLTRDAEVRATNSGASIAKLSVVTEHGFGEHKVTTFVGVTVFGKEAEFAGRLLKGERVAVSGSGYLRKWDGKDGKANGSEFSIDAHRVEKQWDAKGGDDAPANPPSRGRRLGPDDEIPF